MTTAQNHQKRKKRQKRKKNKGPRYSTALKTQLKAQ